MQEDRDVSQAEDVDAAQVEVGDELVAAPEIGDDGQAPQQASSTKEALMLAPGEQLQARLLGRHATSKGFDCLVLRSDEQVFWCVVQGTVDVERRPVAGLPIFISVPDGMVTKTAVTNLHEVRLTRRGIVFSILQPEYWDVALHRTSLRFAADFTGVLIRKEDLGQGDVHPIPAAINDISMGGASVTSRITLRTNERLLLRCTFGAKETHTILCEVARATDARGAGRGHRAGLRFVQMSGETREALKVLTDGLWQKTLADEKLRREGRAEFVAEMNRLIDPPAPSPTRTPQGVDETMLRALKEAS